MSSRIIAIRRDGYVEGLTGAWRLLLRAPDFAAWLRHQQERGPKFVDSAMHEYCHAAGLVWARTSRLRARCLTWDLYHDAAHPYTRLKRQQNFDQP